MGELATEVREAADRLSPAALVELCGLPMPRRTSPRNVRVPCPIHGGDGPHLSVFVGTGGGVRWTCLSGGCEAGAGADAIGLWLATQGYSTDGEGFVEGVRRLADRLGLHVVEQERRRSPQRSRRGRRHRPTPPAPARQPERCYPPADEVRALWDLAGPVADDAEAERYLAARGLLAAAHLVRVLPHGVPCPPWAVCGRPWSSSGHRIVVPWRDHHGEIRALRAWLVEPRDHVVQPQPSARARRRWATLGVEAGSWGDDLARRIPSGSRVIVRTDHDMAGERYAEAITASLAHRCDVRRARPEAATAEPSSQPAQRKPAQRKRPKRVSPKGYSTAGLVLADEVGCEVLEHGAAPWWWPAGEPLMVVVSEGEPDWLSWRAKT